MTRPIHPYLPELVLKVPVRHKLQQRRRAAKAPATRVPTVKSQPWRTLLNEFLESSSIHGLAQFSKNEMHVSERALWTIVMVTAIMGTFYIGLQSWRRYQQFPTVISMEKDYRNWNTTFAMATVCPEIKIDEPTLRSLAVRYKVDDVEGFVQFFKILAGASYENFNTLPEYSEVTPDQFLEIIIQARYNFSFKLSNSQDIDQDLLLMVTENNLCYGVNTDVGTYFSIENFNKNLPIGQGKYNLINGSPLDGEVFVQVMNMSSGYNVSLTGPYDMPDVSVRRFYSKLRYYLLLDITALSIISSDHVRSLSPEQRKCRFFDESILEVSEIYSYNLCRMQCRADLAFELCKCIPYFYRKSNKRPYCNATGMRCLGQHEKYLTNLRDPDTNRKLPCGCLPLCNDVHYLIELETHLQWTMATNVKFSMINYPRTRLKREVIFGFADLLVSIGGTAGFFLGCSVLSFIEILYYLTLRLFFYLRNHVMTSPLGRQPPSRRILGNFSLYSTPTAKRFIRRN